MNIETALISGKIEAYISPEYIIRYNKRKQIAHITYVNGGVVTIFSGCINYMLKKQGLVKDIANLKKEFNEKDN